MLKVINKPYINVRIEIRGNHLNASVSRELAEMNVKSINLQGVIDLINNGGLEDDVISAEKLFESYFGIEESKE